MRCCKIALTALLSVCFSIVACDSSCFPSSTCFIEKNINLEKNNCIYLKQKPSNSNSTKNSSWILDYKKSTLYIESKPHITYVDIVLLAEQKSMARPRILTFVIRDSCVNNNFKFNYFESRQTVLPKTTNIDKCLDFNVELQNISINMDDKKDIMYGDVIDKNDNSSGSRKGTKKYPSLRPKADIKIVLLDSLTGKEIHMYFLKIYLTTWRQHFNDITWVKKSKF